MKYILFAIVVILLFWFVWANTGYRSKLPPVSDWISTVEEINPLKNDSINGNIVGIQPYMLETDYLSKERFEEKMELYFSEASKNGLLRENTIVLLPEYLGTWLVVAGEKISVAESKTLTGAMTRLVLSNPIKFFNNLSLSSHEKDKIASGIFRMKAGKMAEIYTATFSKLAQEYQVYISAGSIILPKSTIEKNKLITQKNNPLYNTSFLFLPDGSIHPEEVRKAFPITSEHPFVTAGKVEAIPSFPLPFGNVAIIVCADSWYPETYEAIKGSDIVLVNSYCATEGIMEMPWGGYDGNVAPTDIHKDDIGTISEHEAWLKYALPGRIHQSGATIGANVFLKGKLWDLGTDGQPFFIRKGQLQHLNPAEHGGIWSMQF